MTPRRWMAGAALAALAALGVWIRRPDADSPLRPETGSRETFRPFDLVAVDRDSLRYRDLRGRVTLVNFWASWCGPCRDELPALDSLAATFDTSRVVFAALSDDVDGMAARQFLLAFGGFPSLRIGLGLGALKGRYHYVGLPYTVLVDADGRVARRWFGYAGPEQIAQVAEAIRGELRPDSAATTTGQPMHHPR